MTICRNCTYHDPEDAARCPACGFTHAPPEVTAAQSAEAEAENARQALKAADSVIDRATKAREDALARVTATEAKAAETAQAVKAVEEKKSEQQQSAVVEREQGANEVAEAEQSLEEAKTEAAVEADKPADPAVAVPEVTIPAPVVAVEEQI